MKSRICVKSMVLGAAIMLIGLAVGAIVSPPLIAQRNGVFDEIQCTKLTVVDNMGKTAVVLGSSEESNAVLVLDKQGEVAVTLSANMLNMLSGNEVIIHDAVGNSAINLRSLGGGSSGGFSSIAVLEGGDKGFGLLISDRDRAMTLYDPLETEDIEIRGHKVTEWKKAFQVNISNTRNELALWGKSPYKNAIGFYGDSNEAKQIRWIPEQEE